MDKKQVGKTTQNEIISQPGVWQRTLRDLAAQSREDLPDPRSYDRVIFTGCGSTYYLAVWAARLLAQNGHPNAIALPSSELAFSPDAWLIPNQSVLLVLVSRSGSTSETLLALENFRKFNNGSALAVVCTPDSKLTDLVDHSITTPHGRESGVILTRAFTTMMLAIIWWLEDQIPARLSENLMQMEAKLLANYGKQIREIARDPHLESFYYLGNGRLYGLALEMMLTHQEMSHEHTECYHFMEFRHGPRAFAGPSALLIGLSLPASRDWEEKLLDDMRDLGARTLRIGAGLPTENDSSHGIWELGAEIPAPWVDVLTIRLLQQFTFERGLFKGSDPDSPRNLTAFVKLK